MLKSIPVLPFTHLALPTELADLDRLSRNLYWTWRPDFQEIFRDLNPSLWEGKATPTRIVRETDLTPFAKDKAFVARVKKAAADLDAYLDAPKPTGTPAAYFCAEYATHETFNQYAGGLGILAGDHCKEASDLNLDFVAVGIFYRRGFFKQMIDWSGRQEHLYPVYDPIDSPVVRVAKPGTKEPLTLHVEFPGRKVAVAVWLAAVGRTPLLLMDTDLPENAPEDRAITSQLYTNGREMRLYQEVILGVGGVRMLRALGIDREVWHMNEGHSALLLLERMAKGEDVSKDSVITIHTPVPEGNERFDAKLAADLIAPIIEGTKLDLASLLKKGLGADGDPSVFDMTAFALRHSRAANGVSLLHGETAHETWHKIAGYPVQGITNGVHMPTWLGGEVAKLYVDVKVDESEKRPDWDGARGLDDQALWTAHQAQKRALIELSRKRYRAEKARHGVGPSELAEISSMLDPDALLIGFARRFATYKRASLIFNDEKRLAKLMKHNVQLIFSGKSHPSDRGGQALIEKVYEKTQSPKYRGRILLLEDYDMEIGRHLVQGVDVWLNNPRRPLEASGTSGMKAAANGIPNLSILDGWWDEAFRDGDKRNGYAIGGREVVPNSKEQDKKDAAELYTILEKQVIPAFFKRDAHGVPTEWIKLMKEAIASSLYSFSTTRMLRDYEAELY